MSPLRARSNALVPPLLATIAGRTVVQLSGALGGQSVWSATDFRRWDSNLYLSIADQGYFFYPCNDGSLPPTWCGNGGWLPAYPLLIRALGIFLLPRSWAGVLLSELFLFLSLFVIWNHFLGAKLRLENLLVLGLAVLFPGNVYFHAIFPMSMAVFFSLLFVRFVQEERALATALSGFAAGLTYSSAILLSSLGAVRLLTDIWRRPRPSIRTAFAAFAAPAAGMLAVLLIQLATTGVWGVFFKVHEKYYAHTLPPFETLLTPFLDLVRPEIWGSRNALELGKALQTAVVIVFACVLVIVMSTSWARAGRHAFGLREEREALILALALVYLLFPHYFGNPLHSHYRGESLLMPAVILARRLPIVVNVSFLLVFLELTMRMSVLFFQNELV